ncbi:MAG TPA: endolytic transglycosylase MltG [Steroidobacteraceae bacterium]|nr:endolytic transglycosylase MltG [Steroidobacteraceae bacterium]
MAERAELARRWLRRAALAAALLVVVLGVAATLVHDWLKREYLAPGPAASAARIRVEPGSSVRAVLARLESQGVVHNARAVVWYLHLRAEQPRMQAGTYEIPPHSTPEQIITMFEEGKVLLEQLTVVEGSTFGDFLELLSHEPDVTHTLAGKTPAEAMVALGRAGENPEGRFFPDTYRFAANTADAVVLGVAYEKMSQELAAAWSARSPTLPFDSPTQALILASMVEKEAQLKSERRRIAGVFVARLRKGMRLQSDPTVIYGLGAKYDGQIHTRDLLADTPYNTYTRSGLPPAPIALPGRESLMAAVQPDETGELYFVASGLGDGAHHFSKTLQEHNSAVQAYLARLRQQRAADRAPAPPPPAAVATAKPMAKRAPQRTAPAGAGTHP